MKNKTNHVFSNKELQQLSLSEKYGLKVIPFRDKKMNLTLLVNYKTETVNLNLKLKKYELGLEFINAHKKYYSLIYETGTIIEKK